MKRASRTVSFSQKGQMAVEMLLLLVVLFGVFSLISREFKKNDFIRSIVAEPWEQLSGLLQNGVWQNSKDSLKHHPSQKSRHSSIAGDR